MKLFSCPHCGQRLYFENAQCLACGSIVLYDPDAVGFVLADAGRPACANATECACNWVATAEGRYCRACVLNRTIPDLSIEGNRGRWIRIEAAKRRAVYTLLAYALPVEPKQSKGDEGLAFDFLAETPGAGPGGERILTGHENGLITLNVAEADGAERERMRAEMREKYRTLLGHFRHELGHYYWDRLVRDDPARLARFRDTFGDDTTDYMEALNLHYANGAPPDWQSRHISAYAASHPWEDWAESWAHYLHIVDTLEMVDSLGFPLPPGATPVAHADIGAMLERWLVLSEASNSINRCMGLPDLYPFVISDAAAAKLGAVHDLLADIRASAERRDAA
ncbi:MAG: putative zinc-binding metallopeptidase [Rhizobiaceae bacterium]